VTPEGTVNYTYDNASRRATMTVVGQTQVVYTYDNANRLTQIQQGTSTVTIGYDDADRRTSVTYPNTNSITYGYNVASELTSLTYKQGATTLGDLTYTYDLAGNRIKTGGTFARSNIPPALTTTNYNANNQQLTFGTTTEAFDLNGNLATSTDAGVTTTYTWNARNQLTGISRTGFTASFTYDSFGRRTGKTVQGTTTNFLYDGLNPVQEKSGATVTANLLTGLGIDEFFTRTDGVGVRSLLPDALGSTVALGDGTGTLQTQYTYEPFGFVSQTGAASTSSYKFTGREDDGSGLMYYRARYYQPRLQRFISEDPLGFDGGDVNLYGYVRNNPLTFIDPLGLIIDTSKIGRLKDPLEKVKRTKKGKELCDALEQSSTTYKIRERELGDPGPAFFNKRTNEIVVDPNFHPNIETTKGIEPASTERILGHEMGHAATGASDRGPGPGINAILNENPIAIELGQNPRIKY
jgi:RHS repeat-associated protein